MLLFCFGNSQANSSLVGSLRKVLCPGGGACWQTTFITGKRNALISERTPSLRVKGFTNFMFGFSFLCWKCPQGASLLIIWDANTCTGSWNEPLQTLGRAHRAASAPWLRHPGVKGSPKDFCKASGLLSRLVLSLLCSHFVVLINFMITQQTCFYSVCCCGS